MIQTLSEFLFNPITIAVIIIGSIAFFMFICIRIKIVDSRSLTRRNTIHLPENTDEEFSRQRKLLYSEEDLEELEALWRKTYGKAPTEEPDTIEMSSIATERDHGETREGDTRTESAD